MWQVILGMARNWLVQKGADAVTGANQKAGAASATAGSANRRATSNPTRRNRTAADRANIAAHIAEVHAQNAARVAERNDMMVGQLQQMAGELAANATQFFHSISVTVKGGPKASLRRCWFLAVAATFGRRRRGTDAVWAEAMDAQWDITGKSVTCTLSYTTGALTEPWTNFTDESPFGMLQRGPDQVTIGAGWPLAYMTLLQGANWVLNGNQEILGRPVIGGILRPSVLELIAPLPGEIRDPAKLFQLAAEVGQLNGLPAGRLLNVAATLNGAFTGWTVTKNDIDSQRDRPNAIVQPFTVTQTIDALSEMPIRQNLGDTGLDNELLPYVSHCPESTGLPGWRYVRRGGTNGIIPTLPDDGRIITTGEKLDERVQSPKPPVDGLARGHLLTMVAAALASPGVLVAAPPSHPYNTSTLAAEGRFVRPPNAVWFAPIGTDKYRYQPVGVVAQVRLLINAIRMSDFGGYVPPAANVRPTEDRVNQLIGG